MVSYAFWGWVFNIKGPVRGDETYFRVEDLPEKITDIYSRVLTTLLFWLYAYIDSQTEDFGPPPMATLL